MTWGDSAAVSALKYACKALRPGQIHTVSPFAAAGSPTTTQARVQSRVVTWAMEEGVRGATSTFMWRLAHAKALGWPGFAGIFQGRQNAMLYYLTINKPADRFLKRRRTTKNLFRDPHAMALPEHLFGAPAPLFPVCHSEMLHPRNI